MSEVEILTTKDFRKAARTLYESFDDDDVARYTSNHLKHDPVLREKVDLALYESYVYSLILKGLVVAVKGDNHENESTYETVALWATPEGGDFTADPLCMLRSGWLRFAWLTGAEGRSRVFKEMFHVLHDNEEEILADEGSNAYTLVYLGSTPRARGKGNARKMFEFVFQNYVDKNNSLAYLESSSLTNIPIYKRFGFEFVKDIWLGDKNDPKDSAMMSVMVRGRQGERWSRLHEFEKEAAAPVEPKL